MSSPQAAGTLSSPILRALDAYDNLVTDYTGTVHFSTDNANAALPVDYTFTAGPGMDNGMHTFTNGVQLKGVSAGCSVRAADGLKTGQEPNIVVTPGVLDHFTMTGITGSVTADDLLSPTVKAYDAYNNLKTDYLGTLHFSTDNVNATLPNDYTFTSQDLGSHTFTGRVQLKAVSSGCYLNIADGPTVLQQSNVVVTPGALDHFTFTGITSPVKTSDLLSPWVKAYDAYGNMKTDYRGTVTFSTDNLNATLPADYVFLAGDGGSHLFTDAVQLKSPSNGSYVEAGDGLKTSRISNIVVTQDAPSPKPVSGPGRISPGEEIIYRPADFDPPALGPAMVAAPAFPIFTPEGPVMMPGGLVPFGGGMMLVPTRIPADFVGATGGAKFSPALTPADFGAVTGGAQFPKALTPADFGAVTGGAQFPKALTPADFGAVTGGAQFPKALTPADFGAVTGGAQFPKALTPADFGAVSGGSKFQPALTHEDFGAVSGGAKFQQALTHEDFGTVTGGAKFQSALTHEDFGAVSGGAKFLPALTHQDFGAVSGGSKFQPALTHRDFGAVSGRANFQPALTHEDFGSVTGRAQFNSRLSQKIREISRKDRG